MPSKKKPVQQVINEAALILAKLGIPTSDLTTRQLEKMSMAFLAVADVKRPGDWSKARVRAGKDAIKSREIIEFINESFGENISSGSYDDIRRKDLKMPVMAEIILAGAHKADSARNDPTRGYSISPECIGILNHFGSLEWEKEVSAFTLKRPSLAERIKGRREIGILPVTLPSGQTLTFSPGEHNLLQKSLIEQFLPRYGYGSHVLYVGDTAKKFLVHDQEKLSALKFFSLDHGELPDVVAYSESRNWLYLIEAVHSSGPISTLRLLELQRLIKDCSAEVIYVTAFLDRATFRQFAPDIAWETEVWIAEAPDHLIHFNGDKFLGPYQSKA